MCLDGTRHEQLIRRQDVNDTKVSLNHCHFLPAGEFPNVMQKPEKAVSWCIYC